MEINLIISSFVIIPLWGFLFSLIPSEKNENIISKIAYYTVTIQLISILLFLIFWIWHGATSFNIKELVIYESSGYDFVIDFYFDKISAVYLFVGAFVTFLITRYSAYYMHMELGYKRFFNTILFFYLGYNLTILSGNFETLFIGWEVLGISSFLLIAFYRERYLPVKNAVKVFSIYRIGDIGILLAMWLSHHLWHENITFFKLYNYNLVHEHLANHTAIGVAISLCLLIAASAKSAQFPFSSWLPRAMEGPTPSSAIFYGSLSVHLGVFFLLRTFPFWEQQISVRVIFALVGILTAIISFYITRIQTTIKSQIAYASISQIGLMFVEISFGFENLALIHFTGNAFLRTYQLLVSPSIVSYKINDQLYHYKPHEFKHNMGILKRIRYTLYVVSMKEWGLDKFMSRWIFMPFKKLGHSLDFITAKNLWWILIPIYLLGVLTVYIDFKIPFGLRYYLPELFSFIAILLVMKSFSERESASLSWLLILFNHCWIALAVSFNEHFDFSHIIVYLSGIIVSGVIGYLCLVYINKKESGKITMFDYLGYIYEYPKLAILFLAASLGLMGFPITQSFIGEDLILSHIHQNQYILALLYSLSFVFGGIATIRIYARIFLGPHIKTTHETPLKSS